MLNPDQALWSVAVLAPPYKSLTYCEPDYFPFHIWQPGLRVLVPMGARNMLRPGVLESRVCLSRVQNLKFIHWPLERSALISLEYLDMIQEMASRYASSPSKVMSSVLPASLRTVPEFMVTSKSGEKIKIPAYDDRKGAVENLAMQWMTKEIDFAAARSQSPKIVSVAKEPPWSILPNARVQWKIMDLLWEQGGIHLSRLRSMYGPGVASSLKSLEARGLVSIALDEHGEDLDETLIESADLEFSADQKQALDQLLPRLDEDSTNINVLHGITGSGKTLVYLRLVQKCLENGRSAFLLAPEIAIAAQLYAQARGFIRGHRVFLHHGHKSAKARDELFEKIQSGAAPVLLVGTRSALFMPMKNIGLIVVDEEHDESFKQDQGFVYQAKEIAHYLALRDRAMLVLGSATPDIKTYFAARENMISLVSMNNRVGKSNLPEVSFVDLKKDPPVGGPLSKTCTDALVRVIERGEQAVIMHNRRGYSPIIMCSDCGETSKCANCQVSLTFHKQRQRLVCHYCGQSLPFSIICSSCKGSEFVPLGDGTEKVEEYFVRHFKDAGVLRLDRDSARNPATAEQILSDFVHNKAGILVGTQMLSKGHTFPNVTLGIVLDGDLGLGLPDYRSSERIFQLLVQLSGRAGRGDKPGQVYIQTRNPGHYCWKFVQSCDYQGFFEHEISRRRIFKYPPFVKLGLIRVSFPSNWTGMDGCIDLIKSMSSSVSKRHCVKIMGPAPAPLSKLKNRDRYQLLVKADVWANIRNAFHDLQCAMAKHKNVRISLDLDPLNML